MPAIPQIVAPELTPPPEMNPAIAGKPGQAMAAAADQFGSVSDFGQQVSERIKKAQDEGLLLGAENSIAADIQKAHAGLANWTDYTNADQLKQDTATALREKYADKYGNRPDLWRFIEPYLGKELNSYNGIVDQKTAQLTAHFNRGALTDSLANTENEAATEPTLDGKEMHWAIADAKIDAMVRNGSIWSDEGETMKKELRSRTIATEVERAANPLNAPEIMQAELDRLKEYKGKGYVDPRQLAEMEDHMGEAYKVASRNSDEKAVATKGDAWISTYNNDPTVRDPATQKIDYLKAAQKADDNPDIPTKVKKYIREEYEQRDGVQKRITNETNQKVLDDLAPRLYDTRNPLTSAEVKQRALLAPSQQGYIPREVESHLLTSIGQMERENRAISMQARSEYRQEAAEKSQNMAYDLLQNLGPLVSKSDLTPYVLKGLSRGDAEAVWQAKDLSKDKGWGVAVGMLNASPLYDHTTDEGRAKLAKDTLDFARTVQNKKLSGSQITQELQNELHPQEEAQHKEVVKSLLDNLWPIAKQVVTGIPQIYKTEQPATAPKVGDTKTFPNGAKGKWNGFAWQVQP